MLKLYHWEPNANSGKPILAMEEKGVDFESGYLDLLNFDQHAPEYLKINPMGTIPALVHDDLMLNKSTAIMEYVDAAFPGPSLRPSDPEERWRMRWWMKWCDQYFGPSASMHGWNAFVGPSVRNKDPEELKRKIEAIPLKERRIAWTKAIYGKFSKEELEESGRRIAEGVKLFEENLKRHPWIAGAELFAGRHQRLQHLLLHAGEPERAREPEPRRPTPWSGSTRSMSGPRRTAPGRAARP